MRPQQRTSHTHTHGFGDAGGNGHHHQRGDETPDVDRIVVAVHATLPSTVLPVEVLPVAVPSASALPDCVSVPSARRMTRVHGHPAAGAGYERSPCRPPPLWRGYAPLSRRCRHPIRRPLRRRAAPSDGSATCAQGSRAPPDRRTSRVADGSDRCRRNPYCPRSHGFCRPATRRWGRSCVVPASFSPTGVWQA